MKRLVTTLLILSLLLGGCASQPDTPKQYTATFLTLFDTVTTVIGPGETEEEFQAKAQKVHDDLLYYHQLFDIYQEYEGINNLKTLNDQAGIAPVTVDQTIIELLQDCKSYYELTGGKVNAAMGSVLSLWHEARTDGLRDPRNAKLPERDQLTAAAEHTDIEAVIIDEAASTVFFSDPQLRLDVGAIAKGWATQRVAENAPAGLLISVGGNVCATGPKNGDTPWVIGIQNPEGEGNLHTLYLKKERWSPAVTTSVPIGWRTSNTTISSTRIPKCPPPTGVVSAWCAKTLAWQMLYPPPCSCFLWKRERHWLLSAAWRSSGSMDRNKNTAPPVLRC